VAKSFFGEWFEKAREKALGRIHIYPGLWVFSKDAPDEDDAQSRFTRPDADGVSMECIGQKAVFCGNQVWQDQYPRIARGKVYNYAVPWSVCRKCRFYQKSDDGIKFPRCLWKAKAQTVSEANSVAAQSIVDGIQKTAETVDKIFGAK
jgi:hypothetical protein